MGESLRPAAWFSIFIFLLLITHAGARTGGYVVEPVSMESVTAGPHDPVPLSFFELSPRVMAIAIALSFFPALQIPLDLVFLLKLFAWLGYRRVSETAFLRNGNRRRIYETICTDPGINYPDLVRLTGIKRGPLRYHLLVLSAARKIIGIDDLKSTCFFRNSGEFSLLEKHLICHMRNAMSRQILDIIVEFPDCTRHEIGGKIGISDSSVSWYMNRFIRSAVVTPEKRGREVHYSLTREAADAIRTLSPLY